MEGKYKTKDGSEVNIICFDHPNNMAYVDFGEGEKRWVAKMEYEKWMPTIYIPDIPAQIIDNNKIENDAIQIREPEEVSLDEAPENCGEMEQRIPEPEEPTEEGESKSEEEVVKPKRKYNKKK